MLGQLAANLTGAVINGISNDYLGSKARRENYEFGELAAQHADQRTRALYKDLQSPAALLAQYREAGLSPSLMFGGSGAGGSIAQGAQGNGAAGVGATTASVEPINLAQIELMKAEARKANAEANTEEQTGIDEKRAQIEKIVTETGSEKLKQDWQVITNNILSMEQSLKGEYWEREYVANINKVEQEVKNLQETLNGLVTDNKIKSDTADQVIEFIKNRVTEQAAEILLKQAQTRLTNAGVNLTKTQCIELVNRIAQNWAHIRNEKKSNKISMRRLEAQINQWAVENGIANKKLEMELAQLISEQGHSWVDSAAKLIDALIPF